jgi:hypothetical protein
MKKLLIIISVLAAGSAYGQTRTGAYNKIQADHWKDGAESTSVIKRVKGSLKVEQSVILIDSGGVKPQAYDIVKRSNVQDYCYDDVPAHYGIQFLTVLYQTKSSRRVMDVILMFGRDKRTITDVILKKSKHSNVTYTFD